MVLMDALFQPIAVGKLWQQGGWWGGGAHPRWRRGAQPLIFVSRCTSANWQPPIPRATRQRQCQWHRPQLCPPAFSRQTPPSCGAGNRPPRRPPPTRQALWGF